MMNNFIIFLIASFFYLSNAKAQLQINGSVIDFKTKRPVIYANVGIPQKGVGTITNEQGLFTLSIKDSLVNNFIRISMIGYKPILLKISELKSGQTIYMQEDIALLNEVIIKPTKIKTVGNKTTATRIQASFTGEDISCELAAKLNIPKNGAIIRKAFFNVTNNPFDSILFRVNFYNVKNSRPNNILLSKAIYKMVKIKKGIVTWDFTKDDISVGADVYLALELIKPYVTVIKTEKLNANQTLRMSGAFFNNMCFKKTSEANWEKFPFTIGLWAEIEY